MSSFFKTCVFVCLRVFFASSFIFVCVFFAFCFFFASSFLFVFYAFFFLRSGVNECRSRCISNSSLSFKINLLYTYFKRQSKYLLKIKMVFIISRLLYCVPMQMRSFASPFLCVFVLLLFGFFFAFSFFFFLHFCFMHFRSLKYASPFSEICGFVLQQKLKT